jgi:acyl carrier protein
MESQITIERINSILADEFEIEQDIITAEAPLRETLDLDSLDFVDLVVLIEANFGFKVEPDDLRELLTFRNLYDYILDKGVVKTA